MQPLQPIQPDDHVRGDAGAPVTIVEYGDYDCPHTRAAQASIDELLARGDLRFVFRYFPLRELHANAEILARIAEAAQRQDLFWPMHDHLMHHRRTVERDALTELGFAQRSRRGRSKEPFQGSCLIDILADAAEVGLDLRRVHPLLDDPGIAARIERDLQGGRAAGVHSTPSFFFNGALHDGHYDLATLAEQLRRARAG